MNRMSYAYRRLPLEERFALSVDRSTGILLCHPWTGSLRPDGYGQIIAEGVNHRAHVLAYTFVYGPPKDQVLHTCDYRPCCNTLHLYDGTPKQNAIDTWTRSRQRPLVCIHGHPRVPENLTPGGACRTCKNIWSRAADAANRERVECPSCGTEMLKVSLRCHVRRYHS